MVLPVAPLNLQEGAFAMMKRAWLFLLCAALAPSVHASDGNFLVRFDGAIGVIPVSSAAGVANADGTFPNVNRNVVRGVNPPGQIWVMADLKADIRVDGSIRVRGRGLLLGGGNNIGLNGNARVFATLICETAAPFPQHSTNLQGVPLAPNGDFRINDVLTTVPVTCPSPVLLIRNANNQSWFAAGIPKLDNDNDDEDHN
jgi:hypothetical protein